MKLPDLILLSTRTFTARPMRTFLTILGVSVGIGTVLFLVSLGYVLQNMVLNKITTADALLSIDIGAGDSGSSPLDKSVLKIISEIEGVAETSPLISLTAQMSLGDLTGDALVNAVNPSFFRLGGISPAYGKLLDDSGNYGAVLSAAGIKLFNLSPEEAIGKEITLNLFIPGGEDGAEEIKTVKRNDKYIIRGIVADENSSYIYIPANSLADLNIINYSQIKLKVSRDEYLMPVRNKMIASGFLVSSLSDTIDQAKNIFRVIQIILALFGLVALAVSAIGMFNTMTVALLERISEIGILRSIGASANDIRLLFLVESVLMGFLGGLGGIIIGYAGGEIANFGLNVLAKTMGGQPLDLFYRPLWFIGFIIIFSTIIGLLTGIYPSHRASKLNPLEALRYK
ncbi:ABC transporter permease [Candidatus Falkowbacteria bacterium]|nr:ABC transporter permease [Candidatus Falkowbacteria bacterium]